VEQDVFVRLSRIFYRRHRVNIDLVHFFLTLVVALVDVDICMQQIGHDAVSNS